MSVQLKLRTCLPKDVVEMEFQIKLYFKTNFKIESRMVYNIDVCHITIEHIFYNDRFSMVIKIYEYNLLDEREFREEIELNMSQFIEYFKNFEYRSIISMSNKSVRQNSSPIFKI